MWLFLHAIGLSVCQQSVLQQPTNPVPLHYELEITTHIPDVHFEGRANITLTLSHPTRHFSLNSRNLTINSVLISAATSTNHRKHTFLSVVAAQETIQVSAANVLPAGVYILALAWSGSLATGNSVSFFRSQTTVLKDWVAQTNFEPFGARGAFPCFDVPKHKTTYKITLVHPLNYRAYSNARYINSVSQGQMMVSSFEETIPLPTYLVAWAFESRYESTTAKTNSGTEITALYPAQDKGCEIFALEVARNTVNILEVWLNVKLPLSKIDLFPVPDFPGEGMENTGLITMASEGMLIPLNDELAKQQYTALLVSHEVIHHWFGNLVTPKYWNDLWLNEGFAEYMQNIVCKHLFPHWELDSLFFANEVAPALRVDGSKYTHAIYNASPLEEHDVSALFDDITYSKGASVIRMMAHYIETYTDANMIQLLGVYIGRNLNSVVTTTQLVRFFHTSVPKSHSLDEFMAKWIFEPGFPVLDVKLVGGKIEIEQSRFTYRSSTTDSLWWIHLQVLIIERNIRSMEYRMTSLIDLGIFKDRNYSFDLKVVVGNEWEAIGVVVNPKRIGVYRAMYDSELQASIAGLLGFDASLLAPADRAGLVSDIMSLVETQRMEIPQTDVPAWIEAKFGFLRNETSTAAWKLVLESIRRFLNFVDSPFIVEWFRDLIGELGQNLDWISKPSESGLMAIRSEIFSFAIWINEPNRVSEARFFFWNLINKETFISDSSLDDIVYDGAIRWGTDMESKALLNSCVGSFSMDKVIGLFSSAQSAEKAFEAFEVTLRPQQLIFVHKQLLTVPGGYKIIWNRLVGMGVAGESSKRYAWIIEECVSQMDTSQYYLQAQAIDSVPVKKGLERNRFIPN